jgi:transcriptional regulator with XRE-family HTH domain
MTKKETFGERVRRKRMDLKITLRKFAEMVGVSPTYISQIERDEFAPPSESKIGEMARILNENEEELLALAEKIPSDLPGIIMEHPKEAAIFLRTAKGFSRED